MAEKSISGAIPEMRRKDREISREEAYRLLQNGEYGILSTSDESGFCYGTPLSYVVKGDSIFFHCAKQGKKLDNIKNNSKVCFTVVGSTEAVYDNDFSIYYESVMAFGTAAAVENSEVCESVLADICRKYLPEYMDKAADAIRKSGPHACVVEIAIEHISGKAKKKNMF